MRRRIVVSLVFLFTIFATGAIVASWYVGAATSQLRNLVELHEVEDLRRTLVISVQTVQADLYAVHTPLARDLDGVVADVGRLDDAVGECASCHHPPQLEAELDGIRELIEDYKVDLSHYLTISASKERTARIGAQAARVGDQLILRTSEMSARASATLADLTDQAASRINHVRIILLVTLVVTTGLGVAVSSYLVRSVTGPIRRLVDATGIIASGDLSHRVADEGGAEFGDLANHFNAMSSALEESYEQLRSTNTDLMREVGERRRAEAQSAGLQSQLLHAQKMEALGTLSAGIAHEFGNLLQVIQGCVDRLGARAGEESPGHRELSLIGDATRRGADLTRRLLTFGSKVDAKHHPINLNERMRHVTTILDRTLPENIEIEVRLAEDLPPVSADAGQIDQVLLNLALNSRDAMPEGGVLRMETILREREIPRSEEGSPEGSQPGEWVVLRVSDTGHGMDQETRRHIFDPFFTTKEVGVGTGLGLATAYGIVTGHGGQIHCQSQPGQGTVFEILLPREPGESAETGVAGAPRKGVHRGNETILLVDDEVAMLEVMRDNLEEHGYTIHTANSGEVALEFFQQNAHAVDLVVLDLGMPGMGGRACLEKLLEVDRRAKVIISTGFGARKDEEDMMEAGAKGFLSKPYQISEILREIEAVLNA